MPLQRVWLLMPYMHSERLDDQQVPSDANLVLLLGHAELGSS